MPHAMIRVEFTALDTDDAFLLDRLTRELAADLRDVGEVTGVSVPPPQFAKSAAELALASLNVLVGADPAYLQSLVDIVVAFLRRHDGRRATLRVGDAELTVDQPSGGEVAEMIRLMEKEIAQREGGR